MTLNDKNVGDIVKIKENGSLVNYIVVHKGKPSDMYDNSCDGVWLLRERVCSKHSWHGMSIDDSVNDYENSDINVWLHNDFLNTLDGRIKNTICPVKIPFEKGNGADGNGICSGANGLPCRVFLLGGYEVGLTNANHSRIPVDGSRLDYFLDGTDYAAKNKRLALDESGNKVVWWLRSPAILDTNSAWYIVTNDSFNGSYTSSNFYIRPTFIMPYNTFVDDNDVVSPKTTLADKNVGDIVFINENGTPTEFIIVQKGRPNTYQYDEECNGIWLLRKYSHSNQNWATGYSLVYSISNVHKWLNGDYLNSINDKTREIIKTVKISAGSMESVLELSCKVFLLSGIEVSAPRKYSTITYYKDGEKLSYFDGTISKYECKDNDGNIVDWGLRTQPLVSWSGYEYYIYINTNGESDYTSCSNYVKARPAFILPYDTIIDEDITGITEFLKVPKPTGLDISEFDYNGLIHTPNVSGFDVVTMKKSGTLSGIAAGEYEISISLVSGYVWEDGTTDDVVLKWKINPITVPKPTLTTNSFEYEGKGYNKTVTINNFDSNIMTKSGIESAYKAGNYSVTFALKDTSSSAWDNGDGTTSIEDVVLDWKITKITADIPYLSETEFSYTGSYIYPTRNNENTKIMSVSGSSGGKEVGNYSITYALYDPDSCTWSDGTVDNKILNWKINKQVQYVKKPYLEPTEFTYDATTKSPTVKNRDDSRTILSGTFSSVVACGDEPFKINVELKTDTNILYKWEDDTTDDVVLTWRVNQAVLDIPTVAVSEFDYDGTTKTADISSYSSSMVQRTGIVSAVKAGECSVIYTIKDKTSAKWADGTTDDKTVTWKIKKSTFAIPTADVVSFEVIPNSVAYNTTVINQTLLLNGFVNTVMTVSGNTAELPGLYTATIKLRDVDSASWADGTIEDKTIEWEITKKEHLVKKPSLANDTFKFNGLTQTVKINDRNDSVMLITSETSGVTARKYKAVAELRDSNVYIFKWEDGSVADVEMPWEIQKEKFDKPTLAVDNFDYNGLTQGVTVNGFNSNIMEYDSYSTFSAVAARKYSVVVSLKDKFSSTWADGSTADVILPWQINEVQIDIPTVTNTTFTYSGSSKSPTISGYNSNVMTVSGKAAVNAGDYTITFTLKDATSATWSDGTIEPKKFKWVINKAIQKLSKPYLSSNDFTYNGRTFVYHISDSSYTVPRGYVYAYVRNVSNTYMSVSGTLRTSSAGDYEIVVTLKDTRNYIAKWNDDTTDPLILKWKVNKAVFEIPKLSSDHFDYGGRWESPPDSGNYRYGYRYASISGFDSWVMNSNAVTGYKRPDNTWVSTRATYYENSGFYTPSQWQIGKYYARFYLKDPASATWSDGTNGEITLEWSISRQVVLLKRPYLDATSFEYDGTEKEPEIKNKITSGIIYTGTLKETEVGNYSITAQLYREFKLEDTCDYRWDDNTVDDIVVMNWNIWSDGVLAVPSVAPLEFTYDGKKHEPVIYGFDDKTMTKSGDFSAVAVGEYKIAFSLKHPDSVSWSGGSTADKVFTWKIKKGVAYLPSIAPDDLMYDGKSHSVTFDEDKSGNSYVVYGFNPDIMTYGGDVSAVQVGDYNFKVFLKDPTSCAWSDGTTEPKLLPFYISKKTVLLDKPYLEQSEFIFDATTKTPNILMWKTPGMEKEGDLSAINAGEYKITISLIEDRNITYLWADHSSDPIELDWKIKGRKSSESGSGSGEGEGDGKDEDGAGGIEKPTVTSLEFIYDKTTHAPEISEYEKNLVSISGVTSSVNAGEFEIVFSLKYPDSCTWTDGTTDDYKVKWVVKQAEISKPILIKSEFTYNGTEQEPVFSGFNKDGMVKTGDTKAKFAGDYNVKIKPDSNHVWLDGTSDELSFDWCIKKSSFAKPILTKSEFTYNGTEQEPVFSGFNSNVMKKVGDVKKTPSGNYTITIAFIDINSSEWETDSDVSDNSAIEFSWKINKAILDKPTLKEDTFSYDETVHTLEFEGFNSDVMTKKGTYSATAAGDYTATIALKDPSSSEWKTVTRTADTSDKDYKWKINKSVFDIPTVTNLKFLYDGKSHAPTVTGFNEKVMNITGIAPKVNAGEYSVVISLRDKNSATWTNGTTEDKVTKWVITKIPHEKPHLTNTEYIYNGGIHAPAVRGLDVSCMSVSGEQSGIGAGKYNVIVSLNDPINNMWSDGKSEPLYLEWVIHGKPVDKPYLDKDKLEYTGKTQTPLILGYKSGAMNKSGDLSGTNIGDYKIVVTLGNNYEWTDGGFDPLELPWKITEVNVKIPIVTDLEFTYDKAVHAPKVTKLNTDMVAKSGTSFATYAGTYKIKFSLKDKAHALWENGTSDDIEVEWVIKKHLLKKPVGDTLHFTYNGGAHRPIIDNPNTSLYVSDTSDLPDNLYDYELYYYGTIREIDVGSYNVVYVIVDKRNYAWEDETNANIKIGWSIGQMPIEKPYLDPDTFQYNGSTRKPNIIGFVSNAMSYPESKYSTNVYSAVETGEYFITINLWQERWVWDSSGHSYKRRIYNYRWADGDTSYTVTLKWTITKGEIDYPTLLQDEFTYKGTSITPPKHGYDYWAMKIVGDWSATDAGDYSIGFVLTDTEHYTWKDGAYDGKRIPWRINKAKISKDSGLPILVSDLTYNAREQSPSWNYKSGKFIIVDGNVGKTVGGYFTGFKPGDNYIWEDDTDSTIYLKWNINVRTLETPKQITDLWYTGESQEPNFGTKSQGMIIRYSIKKSGDVSGINANEYYMKLECDSNCKWDSTGTTTCYVPWEIKKCVLYNPTGKTYKYTGEIINAEFENYHLDAFNISGQKNGRDVGTYTAYFEIKDTSNYVWFKSIIYNLKDGKLPVKWKIVSTATIDTTKKVAIPYQSNRLVYNKEYQEPTFSYDKDLVNIGWFAAEKDADTYYVRFSLKSKDGYTWSDGTTEDKLVPWVIHPKPVPFPYIMTAESDGSGMYYYELEGKKYPVWVNYDPEIMRMFGDTYDLDFSWHTTNFELRDKKNYIWIRNNDAYPVYPVTWKLSQAYVRKPTVGTRKVHIPKQANRPIEDGTMKYPKWDSYDNTAIINLGGEWEGIEAGERFVILDLQPGYIWKDDTSEIKAVPWKIYELGTGMADESEKILLHIPEQINPPFFDGFVKYPEWDLWSDYGFDVIEGVLMEVPAGEYSILLRLKTGYIWEAGTTDDKIVTWVINPADLDKEPSGTPDDTPKEPEHEVEGKPESGNSSCGCGCCCDTGLFDKLNENNPDDGFVCGCLED